MVGLSEEEGGNERKIRGKNREKERGIMKKESVCKRQRK